MVLMLISANEAAKTRCVIPMPIVVDLRFAVPLAAGIS